MSGLIAGQTFELRLHCSALFIGELALTSGARNRKIRARLAELVALCRSLLAARFSLLDERRRVNPGQRVALMPELEAASTPALGARFRVTGERRRRPATRAGCTRSDWLIRLIGLNWIDSIGRRVATESVGAPARRSQLAAQSSQLATEGSQLAAPSSAAATRLSLRAYRTRAEVGRSL